MVFSKNIVKLGKAQILNGKVDRGDIITLFYSKENDKVYKKTISISNKINVNATSVALNYTEILPITQDLCLSRRGEVIGVIYD